MMPIILEGSAISAAAVTTIQTNPISDGVCAVILSVMAVDKKSAISGSIELGIVEGTRLIPVASQAGPITANTSFNVRVPCVLREGQRIYAKFSTPASGDELVVIAHGFIKPLCL